MKTATYQRKDTAIRGDIIKSGGTRDVYHIEDALSPDTLEDRNEYRSRIESLAAKYNISTRSTLPIN